MTLHRFFGWFVGSVSVLSLASGIFYGISRAGSVCITSIEPDAGSVADRWFDRTSRVVVNEVVETVRPAMEKTARIAADPRVASAIRAGSREALSGIANEAVVGNRVLDVLAFFDAHSGIVAISDRYPDGSKVPEERVRGVTALGFSEREIVSACVGGSAVGSVLEFQVTCDITPAYFDSSGLSIAYSEPVFDPETKERIGVVSARLRFERLIELLGWLDPEEVGGRVYFVSEDGRYFSEEIRRGLVTPPIPEDELALLVASLPRVGRMESRVTRTGGPDSPHISLRLVEGLSPIKGGGLALMCVADRGVIERELSRTSAMGRMMVTTGAVMAALCVVSGVGFVASTLWQNRRLKEARREALAASEAKSAFLANMSHELRTPLNAIMGYAELIASGEARGDEARRQGRTICSSGDHLLAIINDVLDLSKIEARRMDLDPVPTPLAPLVNETVALVAVRAKEKGLELRREFVGPVPSEVLLDTVRFRQIVLNLMSNAVKFTERGRVSVSVRANAIESPAGGRRAEVRLMVADTGIGMSEEQLARVFSPFTQANQSTTRVYGGTGLGLSITKRLVELMGGALVVRSRPGEGTAFDVRIPVDLGEDAEWAPAVEPVGQDPVPVASVSERVLEGLRIMVAEDGPDNQRLIRFILERAGAEVTIAQNGREAVELFGVAGGAGGAGVQVVGRGWRWAFDLVFMDMQMPELDGYGATRELRAMGVELPIIALTANAMSEDRRRCIEAGCDDYMTKPLNRGRLLSLCMQWASGDRAASAERAA